MTQPVPEMPVSTFIVRFWHEQTASGTAWRGRITHVQSSEGMGFVHLRDMLEFMHRLGIAPDEAETGGRGSQNGDQDERQLGVS